MHSHFFLHIVNHTLTFLHLHCHFTYSNVFTHICCFHTLTLLHLYIINSHLHVFIHIVFFIHSHLLTHIVFLHTPRFTHLDDDDYDDDDMSFLTLTLFHSHVIYIHTLTCAFTLFICSHFFTHLHSLAFCSRTC